jgi:hypothetical protein
MANAGPRPRASHFLISTKRKFPLKGVSSRTVSVFVGEDGKDAVSRSTVEHQHVRVRRALSMVDEFDFAETLQQLGPARFGPFLQIVTPRKQLGKRNVSLDPTAELGRKGISRCRKRPALPPFNS